MFEAKKAFFCLSRKGKRKWSVNNGGLSQVDSTCLHQSTLRAHGATRSNSCNSSARTTQYSFFRVREMK